MNPHYWYVVVNNKILIIILEIYFYIYNIKDDDDDDDTHATHTHAHTGVYSFVRLWKIVQEFSNQCAFHDSKSTSYIWAIPIEWESANNNRTFVVHRFSWICARNNNKTAVFLSIRKEFLLLSTCHALQNRNFNWKFLYAN